jgi:hypothetical protein
MGAEMSEDAQLSMDAEVILMHKQMRVRRQVPMWK